jgi:hypothetical protein
LLIHLLIYSIVQTEFLVAYGERLAKHVSRISIALFEMMLASLYIFVLVEIGVLMLMIDLLNLLFTSFYILAHGYMLVISL